MKKYQINEEESTPIRMHLLESWDIINAFDLASDLDQIVFFDERKAKGTEHLSSFVEAIRKGLKVRFKHFRNWLETSDYREISPLALKEVKYAWYLIGLNEKGELRNYGLDRIHHLTITSKKFEKPDGLNLKDYYQNVFGILNDSSIPVETIKLQFSKEQGHYIKSLPIHSSQKVIQDDENGLIIELRLKINHELISEILSYGDQVRVLEPEGIRKRCEGILNDILINIED
ncbi:helix-turn-helix transcriptional regulator [Algoriphagus formosus]|uniref:helix-turn-helix transcriptional regulator n=1 Tax=Algoriphagus formosus TaxID=2007308 RepID=UPI0012FD217A|nr:WYL domain-containing protein [Algoriphagus formosus]